MTNSFKSGFVSLIGRPSSGKSTLMNTICGYKVSIVSPLPQTTRFAVRGVVTEPDYQIIFIDTPGYHKMESYLNRELTTVAEQTLRDGDLVLYLVDLSRDFGEEEEAVVDLVRAYTQKAIIVFNKIDNISKKPQECNVFNEVHSRLPDIPYVFISAENGSGIKEMEAKIASLLPEGPMYYPEEYVTDQSIPFRIEETVREKVFERTKEEVPHSVYVKTENLNVTANKIKAYATIYVDRESQKGIVVGKNGSVIKEIGSAARESLVEIFERNVQLFLTVKVHANWKKDKKFVDKMFRD